MKTIIKYNLSRLGLLLLLDLIRRLSEIAYRIQVCWTGIGPPLVKGMVLSVYRKHYGLTQFIQTGTYIGDTLAYIAQQKTVHATNIALDGAYCRAAKQCFSRRQNIAILQGNSGKLMPKPVRQLQTPALFCLYGNYSGGQAGKGELNTPISAELEANLDSHVKAHVILSADTHCFEGSQDYPHLDRLLETVRRNNSYHIEILIDIIRLMSKHDNAAC